MRYWNKRAWKNSRSINWQKALNTPTASNQTILLQTKTIEVGELTKARFSSISVASSRGRESSPDREDITRGQPTLVRERRRDRRRRTNRKLSILGVLINQTKTTIRSFIIFFNKIENSYGVWNCPPTTDLFYLSFFVCFPNTFINGWVHPVNGVEYRTKKGVKCIAVRVGLSG